MSKLIPFWNSYLEAGKDDRNAWGCINLDRIRYIGTASGYAALGRDFYRGVIDGCDTFVAVTYSGDDVFGLTRFCLKKFSWHCRGMVWSWTQAQTC